MKLYLKQKVFSWKDKTNVFDESGNTVYHAESEILSLGKKLHLMNESGEEVSFIHQKVLSFLPKYFIGINGEDVAEVTKKMTFMKPKYVVEGPGWTVTGNFFSHDYVIEKNGTEIASVSKQWMTWGDSFEIDVINSSDAVMVLSVVLVIDACMDAAAASAAASN